ncbi:MAG: phage terminase large subunit family protein [Candidatus Micrarchaeia archaeon]
MELLPSQYIETFFRIRNERINFSERQFWKEIHDNKFNKLVIVGSRGSEKSAFLATKMLLLSRLIPGFRGLYVAPTTLQLRTFVSDLVDDIIRGSPFLQTNTTSETLRLLYNKEFKNNSKLFFRFAFYSPDRCRGLHVDALFIDELQDMLVEVIQAIFPVLDHAKEPLWIMTGTQKTTAHASHYYYSKSKQIEYLIKCESCGHYNYQDENILGPDGLICSRCKNRIYIQNGKYVALNPSSDIYGFRITHLMLPYISYDKIIERKNFMSPDKFRNEILALPSETIEKPLTEYDVRAICSNYSFYNEPDQLLSLLPIYAGIDWGAGIKSYTVITLVAKIGQKFRIIYAKRFTYETDMEMRREIISIIKKFNVKTVVCDWGFGAGYIPFFQEVFGSDRFIPCEYTTSSRKKIEWDSKNMRFLANRTQLMARLFHDIKKGIIEAPRWEEFREFARDLLSIYTDYNDKLQKIIYYHPPDEPDDFCHSLIYALIASDIYRQGII